LPLSDDDKTLFQNLVNTVNVSRAQTKLYNEYYEGWHRLQQLGLAIPDELKQFTVVVNWPRVTVDALEQRLDVTGFRMPGSDSADSALWDVWQYNNLDEGAGFAHTDALAIGRSYVCVGTNDEDRQFPLVTVESPSEMVAIRDPRTHAVTSALRLYGEQDVHGVIFDNRATLYLPDSTRWLILDNGVWVDEVDPDFHKLGLPPVVPFINRNRATRDITRSELEGISEMADVIPIADSASRAITNAQLATETVAVPQKFVLGMSKGDFVDESGNPLPVWQSYFGAVWANSGKKTDVEVGQLPSADLANFETMVNLYARIASGVTSMPIEYFGMNNQNPPSADGQRAGETRLIKKAERKQVAFGNSWEGVQRLVLRFQSGEWDTNARRMETLWRDAGTPTVAQVTDAVVKEYQSGLSDWETAQESLGRSPETIARMKSRREADIALNQAAIQAAQYRVTEVSPPAPTSTN
jgi:hypothetical protein